MAWVTATRVDGVPTVRGDFDPDEARVIARALERDGMEDEGAEWRIAAARAEQQGRLR